MASAQAFDTNHDDMIHDAQMDYYGKRLATCSSDRTIKVFELNGEQQVQVAELKGHEGPVWQVGWAHPKYESLLASCSYDRKVIIWKETQQNQWSKIFEHTGHDSSVNSISWAPYELGLILACASSDGKVSIISHKPDDTWGVEQIANAHAIGVNAVSWSPAPPPGSIVSQNASGTARKRFVTGGCDNRVKVWGYNESTKAWAMESEFTDHQDWVRDVAWAPNIGLPSNTIASCGQDHKVIIYSQEEAGNTWQRKELDCKFDAAVWRVSWSITGNILAVAGGDQKVLLWKQSIDGEWKQVAGVNESGATPQ